MTGQALHSRRRAGTTSQRTLYATAVLAVGATTAALDQIGKWLVASAMDQGQRLAVIPGVVDLHLRANPHGAFGLFASFPPGLRTPILLGLGMVAMCAVVAFSVRTLGWSLAISISLGLILGGAVSNLADRVLRGEVLDFIDIHLGSQTTWPTFNLADVAITAGSVMLMVAMLTSWRRQRNQSELKDHEGGET